MRGYPTLWTPGKQQRLIELFRQQRTLEEMARELSLPLDVVEERVRRLDLEGDIPEYGPEYR